MSNDTTKNLEFIEIPFSDIQHATIVRWDEAQKRAILLLENAGLLILQAYDDIIIVSTPRLCVDMQEKKQGFGILERPLGLIPTLGHKPATSAVELQQQAYWLLQEHKRLSDLIVRAIHLLGYHHLHKIDFAILSTANLFEVSTDKNIIIDRKHHIPVPSILEKAIKHVIHMDIDGDGSFPKPGYFTIIDQIHTAHEMLSIQDAKSVYKEIDDICVLLDRAMQNLQ